MLKIGLLQPVRQQLSEEGFIRMAFSYVGIELEFKGEGISEKNMLLVVKTHHIQSQRLGLKF